MPAFKWWVGYTLKKCDTIIASVKKRIVKTTHRYGIEIPSSWDHATKIDKKNGNQLWHDTLAKEIKNVGVVFDVLEDHQNVPVGWTKASDHLRATPLLGRNACGIRLFLWIRVPQPDSMAYSLVFTRRI